MVRATRLTGWDERFRKLNAGQRCFLMATPLSTPRSNSLTEIPKPPLIVSRVVRDGTRFPRSRLQTNRKAIRKYGRGTDVPDSIPPAA